MKSLVLLTCLLTIITLNSFAQESSPTTVEEYNYLTKGYQIQMESGLDMKKGYRFNDMINKQMGNYHFTVKALVREKKDEIAALLVITKSHISSKTYYLCIPQGNAQLVEKYWADLNNWDRPISLAFAQLMSIVYCGTFTMGYEMNKKIKNN